MWLDDVEFTQNALLFLKFSPRKWSENKKRCKQAHFCYSTSHKSKKRTDPFDPGPNNIKGKNTANHVKMQSIKAEALAVRRTHARE